MSDICIFEQILISLEGLIEQMPTLQDLYILRFSVQGGHFFSTFIFPDFSLTSEKFPWRLDKVFW